VKCVCEINKKYNVHIPITNAVNNIIYNNKNAKAEMELLADMLS
jgi:glycerol-3-phosphate dehydrogenase